MIINQCKICRRLGVKLFLKGERCFSPKCAILRKPYVPGKKGKRRVSALSEFGKELKEKQRLKKWYNLRERQFRKYIKENPSVDLLIQKLEMRADNVVFRLGFASSRLQARQFVNHGHFTVNGKSFSIPSLQVEQGDKISVKAKSQKSKIFADILPRLKKHQAPSWLKLDAENFTGEVTGLPTLVEAAPPAEIPTIFEYYSR